MKEECAEVLSMNFLQFDWSATKTFPNLINYFDNLRQIQICSQLYKELLKLPKIIAKFYAKFKTMMSKIVRVFDGLKEILVKKLNQSPIVCCVGRIMRAVTENPHNFKWNTRQHQINLTVIKLKHIKTIRTGKWVWLYLPVWKCYARKGTPIKILAFLICGKCESDDGVFKKKLWFIIIMMHNNQCVYCYLVTYNGILAGAKRWTVHTQQRAQQHNEHCEMAK